jgi:hypothetical protein
VDVSRTPTNLYLFVKSQYPHNGLIWSNRFILVYTPKGVAPEWEFPRHEGGRLCDLECTTLPLASLGLDASALGSSLYWSWLWPPAAGPQAPALRHQARRPPRRNHRPPSRQLPARPPAAARPHLPAWHRTRTAPSLGAYSEGAR